MRSMDLSSRSIQRCSVVDGVRRALGRQVRKLRTAQHADPRVTGPRGEFGGTLRRDCCAASTSEAFTLRGHGCAFLAPSTSVIEGSCDISEVDVHLCRGCAIAAAEPLASCRCRCRRTRTVVRGATRKSGRHGRRRVARADETRGRRPDGRTSGDVSVRPTHPRSGSCASASRLTGVSRTTGR